MLLVHYVGTQKQPRPRGYAIVIKFRKLVEWLVGAVIPVTKPEHASKDLMK
ncbi:MAG: hypothetical protein PHR83_10210 [Paludibacter sp.]|nr:hypothetical protein [Paludibacter sp.]